MNIFFKFKKQICALLCASILLTAVPAQAGMWSVMRNFFSSTQNRVIGTAAVVGLAAISYYLFFGNLKAKKTTSKKTATDLREEAFNKAVEYIQQNNAEEFQKIVKTHPSFWLCSDASGKTWLMYIAENFRGTGFMPDFSNETVKNITMFNAKDQNGKTPLMYAIAAVQPGEQKDKVEFIKKLIEKKDADVLAVDNYGNTVLHYAAHTGCVNLVELILKKMIEKDSSKNPLLQQNKNGMTAQDMAMQRYKSNQESGFKRNYVEVLVWLQNSNFDSDEAHIRQLRTLTLDQLVQEFFDNQ